MRVAVFTELQAIDQQLASSASERDAVLAQWSEGDALRDRREARRQLASTLKQERAYGSDLQWELDEIEQRLHALDELERDGPSDPLVARELVVLREQRARIEEQVIQHFDRLAELEQQLGSIEREVDQLAARWAEREPQLQAELEQRGRALEALQMQRRAVASRVSSADLQLYDDWQRRHRGTALAAIRNRQCSVCRARLSSAVFDLLTMPDALVRCPRCGRVLYLPDEPDA